MQKIKDVLRLHLLGGVDSCRQLARAVGCGKSAVADCLRRAKVANLSTWLLVAGLDEGELSRLLYPTAGASPARSSTRPLPDWTKVREELARADHQMTLALLWEEYKGQHPNGYQYSQFAELYRRFEKRLSVVLRQPHRAGEKSFVDFCDGLPLYDEHSGERIATELFVGALGASSYTFAWATLSQDLPTWLDCHVRMYEFFSGVSAITVPDCLKTGVVKCHLYDPDLNEDYAYLAAHFSTAVVPARVRRPRDKAIAEGLVKILSRYFRFRFRRFRFTSIAEINRALMVCVERINEQTHRRFGVSRRERFEKIEKAALKALPSVEYDGGECKTAKLHPDCYVAVDGDYYSAPRYPSPQKAANQAHRASCRDLPQS
jgi:transposase